MLTRKGRLVTFGSLTLVGLASALVGATTQSPEAAAATATAGAAASNGLSNFFNEKGFGLGIELFKGLGSVSANLFTTDAHESLVKIAQSLKESDGERNHDIAKAVRQAILSIIQAEAVETEDADERKKLLKITQTDETAWAWVELLESDTLAEISEDKIPLFFAHQATDFASIKSPVSEKQWNAFLLEIGRQNNVFLSGETCQKTASSLYKQFPQALREVFAEDFANRGKAYGKLLLTLTGDIRASQQEIKQTLDKYHSEAIKYLKDILQRLSVSEDIPAELGTTHQINLPEVNRYFTGRENTLLKIRKALQDEQRAALQGHSGLGKTRTAIEYALRQRDKYSHIIFVRASKEELETNVQKVAVELIPSLQQAQKAEDIYREFKAWLEKHRGWLLIFDNVDNLEQIKPFVPTNRGGDILYTTHLRQINAIAELIEIEEMPPEEGAELLIKRKLSNPNAELSSVSAEEQKFAKRLSEETQGLPLFLNIAGAFIAANNEISIKEFHELYTKNKARILKEADVADNYQHRSVFVAFEFAYERICAANETDSDEAKLTAKAAQILLHVCAFLAPDAIPEEIVLEYIKEYAPELAEVAQDKLLWLKVVGKVKEMALIERLKMQEDTGEIKYNFNIHRLVQEVIRQKIAEELRREIVEQILEIVTKLFPNSDYVNKDECNRILPHAQSILQETENLPLETETAALLYARTGFHLEKFGQYALVEPLYRVSMRIIEEVHGKEHPYMASSYNNLAYLYESQGRYDEAEPLYKVALRIREKVLGKEHPLTANSYNNLATLYRSQDRYSEAEPLSKEALRIRENESGKNHPSTATSYNNLAYLYKSQGRYDEAEPLYKVALRIRENVLGKNHPDTASSYNNLAGLYESQDRYSEAELLYKDALRVFENVLGKEHPTTKIVRGNLEIFQEKMKNRK
ncbi:MAG TPA: tetratricopeptide repeat protein [Pyrinomonadaceae bacterium]|jgi:tetratricopeptide (TPR) repeat protein